MNSFSERIKYLRKNKLHLTQVEFAERLGLTGPAVTGWEKGIKNPTDATIKHICKEFNVNYSWLVDGMGEMFTNPNDALIEGIKNKYKLRDVEVRLIEQFIKLDEKDRDILLNYLENVFIPSKDDE